MLLPSRTTCLCDHGFLPTHALTPFPSTICNFHRQGVPRKVCTKQKEVYVSDSDCHWPLERRFGYRMPHNSCKKKNAVTSVLFLSSAHGRETMPKVRGVNGKAKF